MTCWSAPRRRAEPQEAAVISGSIGGGARWDPSCPLVMEYL